jgi:hypothetical protein
MDGGEGRMPMMYDSTQPRILSVLYMFLMLVAVNYGFSTLSARSGRGP